MPTNHKAYIAFLFLGIVWGANFIFMKWANQHISPMQVVFARVLFGFLPLIMVAWVKRQLILDHWRYWHHFVMMALLATVVYYYGFAKATAILPSGIAGAISGAIPLFAALLSFACIKTEQLTLTKLTGLILGFAGVLMIANPFSASMNDQFMVGAGYMVLGSLCVGVSFVYAKLFLTPLNIPPLALTTYQLGLALMMLCFITPFGGIMEITTSLKASWGLVLGLGLLGTGMAYLAYYFIIDKLGAVIASSATYLPPVVALMIGAFLVDEPITWLDFLATAIILFGVIILNWDKYQNRRQAREP